ncbi:hypothetical protein RJT34_14450 [Clitoria ternatea]|uniref:Uncharacterized protein n=1 Tax=Clitoria ternatea TaxID=43366 RepID=A0AAN9PMW7_CLITE
MVTLFVVHCAGRFNYLIADRYPDSKRTWIGSMWHAKSFLHPDIVATYGYIFIWDEDMGLEHFNAEECARFDDGVGGDNEVQRTMLEIMNQLDGFDARGNIKVLMATNWSHCGSDAYGGSGDMVSTWDLKNTYQDRKKGSASGESSATLILAIVVVSSLATGAIPTTVIPPPVNSSGLVFVARAVKRQRTQIGSS